MPAHHREKFLITLPAIVEQLQLWDRRSDGIDVELTVHLAALVSYTHQQVSQQLAIGFERPSQAVRNLKAGSCQRVDIRRRAIHDRRAIAGVVRDGLRRIPLEYGNIERNLVVKQPDASANCRFSVACGSKHEADARRDIDSFHRKTVMVEPQAEIEREAGENLPIVLDEDREVVLGCFGRQWRAKGDGAAQRAITPLDAHRKI